MANARQLLPVTLPTWPSCNECLSWSEDDLAVAGGEVVHVLTPRTSASRFDSAGHPQWHNLSLRVNLFRQDEWPEQTPATILDFSIGEEVSNSHVVALEWSKAGLGMHRRCVLGVLTSNLVLSLWETNGTQAQYQRTCVVNGYSSRAASALESGSDRRKLRIRSFAWTSLLETTTISKWGIHYLVVADDDGNITLLHVSKSNSASLGTWEFEAMLSFKLKCLKTTNADTKLMSPVQKRLYHESPVTKIYVSPWHNPNTTQQREETNDQSIAVRINQYFSKLVIARGNAVHTATMCASVSCDGQQVTFHLVKDLDDSESPIYGLEAHMSSAYVAVTNSVQHTFYTTTSLEDTFKQVLQPIRDTFNASFQLDGHYRTRFWGSTVSSNGTKAVACVTLHPSDTIEYTIPSAEKCTLVFKNIGPTNGEASVVSKPAASVHEDILHFANGTLKDGSFIDAPFNKKLLRTYASLACITLGPDSAVRLSLVNLSLQNTNEPGVQEAQGNAQDQSLGRRHDDPEDCEICSATIAFTLDTTQATCRSGHHFSRCQLTFLAIQEPGISKYCSQCGKEFLDITKLGTVPGPSFAQAVFAEFDVCPYCQAKFRG